MKLRLPANNIFSSFRLLKGNARISVICEPLWAIPYVMFNFYLSLYMKELGVTDQELGYLISLGTISGAFFSLIAGAIIDRMGRKLSTFIFDMLSWPVVMIIYFFSGSFAMFALATIINNASKIVAISWNLMIIEDSDNEQRIAAFNYLNIIVISSGILIPLAGILVNAYGVVTAERIFIMFCAVSMAPMMIYRNKLYKETSIGQVIMDERKKSHKKIKFRDIMPFSAVSEFKNNPRMVLAAIIYTLFSIYIPLGTFNSLYFVPFMAEVLKIEKSAVSAIGGIYSWAILVVFVFIIPAVSGSENKVSMLIGLVMQIASLLLLVLIPEGSMICAVIFIIIFAFGYGFFKTFLDAMLAKETESEQRAKIYSLINFVTFILTAVIGAISGIIYASDPRMIYVISILILFLCVLLLIVYGRLDRKE